MQIGYFLSCEEYGPSDIIEQARLAEDAGFERLWISDHYHPWNDAQGESPFVWSMIGAISQVCSLPVTTAVTCPTVRIHPAVIAQAAATSSVLLGGRFVLGVGTGEALNEHILGGGWPTEEVRLEMLEEAVDVLRQLWAGGFVNHRGRHYTVDHARIYTLPDEPPKIYISGFGPKSAALAGRIGDGYVTTQPDKELVAAFRDNGGAGKPMQAGYKVCWGPDADAAATIAHRLWANEGLPGELAQVLPSPRHFEQAMTMVPEQSIRESLACGNDPDEHIDSFRPYAEAGFDEIYISQIGGRERETNAKGFFDFYRDLLPTLHGIAD
jgi:G6PDH family F420-dependent oxidoreductase